MPFVFLIFLSKNNITLMALHFILDSSKFAEKRADTLAAYSMDSAKELYDTGYAQLNDQTENENIAKQGYLKSSQFLDIAEHLIDQGRSGGITKEMIQKRRDGFKRYEIEKTDPTTIALQEQINNLEQKAYSDTYKTEKPALIDGVFKLESIKRDHIHALIKQSKNS